MTVTTEGVVLAESAADSQLPPLVATVRLAEDVAVTFTVWVAGAGPPGHALKLSADWLTVSVAGAAVTVSVTGTDNGLFEAPVAVTLIAPLYVPAFRPVVLMPTLVAAPCAVLDAFVSDNQDAVVDAV